MVLIPNVIFTLFAVNSVYCDTPVLDMHIGKLELVRHVDGHQGDFWRCPNQRVICHNKNQFQPWVNHSKRCWVIYDSGQSRCLEWAEGGCHIHSKQTISTC